MPLHVEWFDVALRLAWTVVACALIGLNREELGRAAGLRTTILVGLAAALSMIEANLLLDTEGKTAGSFGVMDLMRFPLGILSGMGFIGAGTILRRGNLIQGVTTAATLWFVTMMGLCFGGGQNLLGLTALALALIVLWGLKRVEWRLPQNQYAMVEMTVAPGGPSDDEIRATLRDAGLAVVSCAATFSGQPRQRELRWKICWQARPGVMPSSAAIKQLADHPQIARLQWEPQSMNAEI